MIWYIILFSVLGSVGAVTAAALFTLFNEESQRKLVTGLISFATGTLLTAAFLGLIPELHRKWSSKEILKQFILITLGVIVMYLLISLRPHIH